MICHVCQAQAIGQCKSCGKFYCSRHGDVYCVRCAEAVAPAGQKLEPEVAFGIDKEASEDAPPAGPQCYECGEPADRACSRCGRFFCPAHGGIMALGLGGPVISFCADCSIRQERQQMIGCLVGIGAVLLAIIIVALTVGGR
jgi:hypothetical protein